MNWRSRIVNWNPFIINVSVTIFLVIFRFAPRWKLVVKTPQTIIAKEEISIAKLKNIEKTVKVTFHNGSYLKTPKFNINSSLDGLNFYSSTLIREYLVMVHLKGVYISSNGGIVQNDKRVRIYKGFTPEIGTWPIVNSYESVIYPFSANGWVPGHWLNDGLCALIQVPDEILNKSKIMHQFKDSIVKQQLDILGLDSSQVVNHKDEWVYAHDAYVLYGLEHLNCLNVIGLPALARLFRERLGLDKVKPFRYCMSNRPKGPRFIRNFKSLMKAARERFPQVTWQSFVTNEVNLSKTAAKYAMCKLIVVPCGSNCINAVFMAPGTGLCILMANYVDYPNLAWCMVLDVWSVGVSHPTWSHFKTGGKANIPFVLKTIEYMIYALDNGMWPENDDYMDIFDLQRSKKRLQKYPNLFDYNNGPTFSIAELL